MIGTDTLTALRMRRQRPRLGVLLAIEPKGIAWSGMPLMAECTTGELAQIVADPAESFDRADLRCVVGLPVLVRGVIDHARTVRAACMACVDAGASRVIGITHNHDTDTTEQVFSHG